MIITESWKSVKGHPGYEVSDRGRLRIVDSGGGRYLHAGEKAKTYVQVYFRDSDKKESLHRIVARAFLREIGVWEVVNHKDGNPSNNILDNLEIVTIGRNVSHGYVRRQLLGKKMPPLKLYGSYPCRVCDQVKPAKEVSTVFYVCGRQRVRFHPCPECKKERVKSYRKPKESLKP